MVDTSSKGTRIEAHAKTILETQGYRVHRTVRTPFHAAGRWLSHNSDVFGCIDLIAKRHDERTRWIQCTGSRNIGDKKDRLAAIPWSLEHDSVEIWRWVPGAGKRLDGRTGQPRATQYFQVYRADKNFVPDKADRVQ